MTDKLTQAFDVLTHIKKGIEKYSVANIASPIGTKIYNVQHIGHSSLWPKEELMTKDDVKQNISDLNVLNYGEKYLSQCKYMQIYLESEIHLHGNILQCL